ncbi:hypothetical protein BDZ97DRAFT_1650543 [Flammula alnicola]|nr:hypothetical protein BDZ97DRAFT_1650543 [Flammula alnicola]
MFRYLDKLWARVYWTFRSLLWGYPLFKTVDGWRLPDTDDMQVTTKHYSRIYKSWNFLRPFFFSRGYTLYESTARSRYETIPPTTSKPPTEQVYPYARRFYEKNEDGVFSPISMQIWAARDALGRDVVIKLVSDTSSPSDELKVLQYLNTETAQADPRNHTIHLIECLTFDTLIFVVMPRWDCAFNPVFENLLELMICTEALLECVDFLHENRIFHADLLAQNVGMNIAARASRFDLSGMRDPSATRYAVYDFGNSSLYPLGTPLEDIWETKYAGFYLRGLPDPEGPYKPFPLDMLGLGLVLQRHVRHVENIVPELGPFFDRMVEEDENTRFTARQALMHFRNLYSRLTPEQLAHEFITRYWRKDGQ